MAIWLINKEWWTIMTNSDISKWFQLDIIVMFSENYVKVLVIQSCPTLQSHGLSLTRLLCPRNSPGKNTKVDCHVLLQGIFPTQGLNPGLLYFKQILYSLSHQGSRDSSQWSGHSFQESHVTYSLEFHLGNYYCALLYVQNFDFNKILNVYLHTLMWEKRNNARKSP